jgi:hypothetical protein
MGPEITDKIIYYFLTTYKLLQAFQRLTAFVGNYYYNLQLLLLLLLLLLIYCYDYYDYYLLFL